MFTVIPMHTHSLTLREQRTRSMYREHILSIAYPSLNTHQVSAHHAFTALCRRRRAAARRAGHGELVLERDGLGSAVRAQQCHAHPRAAGGRQREKQRALRHPCATRGHDRRVRPHSLPPPRCARRHNSSCGGAAAGPRCQSKGVCTPGTGNVFVMCC